MKMKKYRWIGPKTWVRFARGDRTYDLRRITDSQIAELLKADPQYWGDKFEKVPTKTKQDKGKDRN